MAVDLTGFIRSIAHCSSQMHKSPFRENWLANLIWEFLDLFEFCGHSLPSFTSELLHKFIQTRKHLASKFVIYNTLHIIVAFEWPNP